MSSPSAPSRDAEGVISCFPLPSGIGAALRASNVDPIAVAAAIGLSAPERLAQPQPLLTNAEREAFFDGVFGLADSATATPAVPIDIALRLGAAIRPELMGVIGLAVLSASEYQSAIERCARYKLMISEMHIELT
ncbi:MAG: AraC family transcriptional regulator ligand-binding domain-containing protein, partial [Pseudomonadota bacterium]